MLFIFLHNIIVSFNQEITNKEKYPDVWIVPVKAGIEYMKNPLTHEQLMELGKSDDSPFGCQSIEDKTGIYDSTKNRCGSGQSCKLVNLIKIYIRLNVFLSSL